jgi:alanine racemase
MVRLGIGLYGVNDRTKIFRNVGTLKGYFSNQNYLEESVGYGRKSL